MRVLTLFALVAIIIGLAEAGHFHHYGHGFAGQDMVYKHITSHGTESGHKGKYSGKGGEHSISSGGHKTGGDKNDDNQHAYPKYEFKYGVQDSKTGDNKGQPESRNGDNVQGNNSSKEAGGTTGDVDNASDKNAAAHTEETPNAEPADKGSQGGQGEQKENADIGAKANGNNNVKTQQEKKR